MSAMQSLTGKFQFRFKKKAEVIAQCSAALAKVSEKAQTGVSLSEVREDYEQVVNQLLPLAEAERDTRLQARVRNLQSSLKTAGGITDKKDQVRLEISRIVTHLAQLAAQNEMPRTQDSTSGAVEGASELAAPPSDSGRQESLKFGKSEKSGNSESRAAREIADSTAILSENHLSQRLQELQDRAGFYTQEIEKTKLENQTLFEQNKVLQGQYADVVLAHDEAKELFRVLQNKVATAQIECNRLLLEIQFLSSERAGVLQNLDADYENLMSMGKRYKDLQRGYALAKDEAGVYEDLLTQLDSLLGRTQNQKKVLLDKTAESEKSLETLTEELRTVIKKGKIQFYSQLEGGLRK